MSFLSAFEPIIHNRSLINEVAYNNSFKLIVSNFYSKQKNRRNAVEGTSDGLLAPLILGGSAERGTADLGLLLDEVRKAP